MVTEPQQPPRSAATTAPYLEPWPFLCGSARTPDGDAQPTVDDLCSPEMVGAVDHPAGGAERGIAAAARYPGAVGAAICESAVRGAIATESHAKQADADECAWADSSAAAAPGDSSAGAHPVSAREPC